MIAFTNKEDLCIYRVPCFNRRKHVLRMLRKGERDGSRFWGLCEKALAIWHIRNSRVVWVLDWDQATNKWWPRFGVKGVRVPRLRDYGELVMETLVISAVFQKTVVFNMFSKLVEKYSNRYRPVEKGMELVPYGFWEGRIKYKPFLSLEEYMLVNKVYDDIGSKFPMYFFGTDPYLPEMPKDFVPVPNQWDANGMKTNVVQIWHDPTPIKADGRRFDAVMTKDGTVWKPSKRFTDPENRLTYSDLTLEKLDKFMRKAILDNNHNMPFTTIEGLDPVAFDLAVKKEADTFFKTEFVTSDGTVGKLYVKPLPDVFSEQGNVEITGRGIMLELNKKWFGEPVSPSILDALDGQEKE